MSNHTEELNLRITGYLTSIHNHKSRIEQLENEVFEVKKELSRQKSLVKKYREEKSALRKELLELKKKGGGGSGPK